MNIHPQEISKLCVSITQKPEITKTSETEDFDNVLEQQEVILEKTEGYLSDRLFYVNMKEHINIEIFKVLSKEVTYPDNALFRDIRNIGTTNNDDWVEYMPGDIKISISGSNLSKKISKEGLTKKGMYILGENAFMKVGVPGHKNEGDYKIILATQEDITETFNMLQKLYNQDMV